MARRQFKIPSKKKAKLKEFSGLTQIPVASVVAEWIESYAERGSDYVPDPMEKVETLVDDAVLARAEARAEAEGITLRDMIYFEIDEIDRL